MESISLVEWVIKNVDAQKYYQLKFPEWNGDFNTNVPCPFIDKHKKKEDKRPSFSVNIQGKGGCFCHACGTKIGNIVHFEKETGEGKEDVGVASKIYSEHVRPVMGWLSQLREFKTALRSAPQIYKKLKNEIQIEDATCEKFQLGWNPKNQRITIPIVDQWGQLLNIREYRLPSMRENEKFPKILNIEGYGKPAAMFPEKDLFSLCRSSHKPSRIFWFTGERDTLLAWDRGIPSFCYTTGENVCKAEWIKTLKTLNCEIIVVEDNDDAGQEGAARRLAALQKAKVECSLVSFSEFENIKDFSDFIKEGGTIEEFLKLSTEGKKPSPPAKVNGNTHLAATNPNTKHYDFPKILNPVGLPDAGEITVSAIGRSPELLNRPVWTKAIVSGKMDRTYSVPCLFEVGGEIYNLPISRELLLLVRANDIDINKHIQRWLGTKNDVICVGHQTVTEMEIIPMIEPGVDSLFTNQKCFYFGKGLECNKPYRMRVIPTSEMGSQENVGMIVEAEPVNNILDSYKFDEKSITLLRSEFAGDSTLSCFENLQILAHEVSTRHTQIMNRDDLHLVALLTWLCPLQFEFPFEGIQRGWLNTLVLGDTETGKSKVCQKITKLFQCGVFINAESCSYVGLVGGAVKSSSGMFILRWGKIPLYNRQLVVVEELSGLTTQEISYMSEIRSAGIARYDKAGLTGETSAKTRIICLSNVRGEGKALADYPTGVQAALGLIGQNEDLARFDLTLTATDDEVSGSIINKDRSLSKETPFTTTELDAFKELAMFAWSLKPEQIDFTLSAYRQCLLQAIKMSGKYHSSLPVFKTSSGRLKLARIAIAIACIQFAWDSEKSKLVVTNLHVDCAAHILDYLYSKPSFGYARYSKMMYDMQKVIDEPGVLAKLAEIFKEREFDFLQYILNSRGFSKFDIADSMGVHHMFVERAISQMFLSNLLKKGEMQREWTLSVAGRKWVESRVQHKIEV